MSKRALISILIAGGLATGLGVSTLVANHGDADAQPITFDAAPAPDASVVVPPPGSSLPPLPDPGDDAVGFFLSSYRWVMAGGWLALVPFLILIIWVATRPTTWPMSKSDRWRAFIGTARGKAILALTTSFAGMLLHTILATGGAPSLAALKTAFLAGGLAAGIYSLAKAIVWNK